MMILLLLLLLVEGGDNPNYVCKDCPPVPISKLALRQAIAGGTCARKPKIEVKGVIVSISKFPTVVNTACFNQGYGAIVIRQEEPDHTFKDYKGTLDSDSVLQFSCAGTAISLDLIKPGDAMWMTLKLFDNTKQKGKMIFGRVTKN